MKHWVLTHCNPWGDYGSVLISGYGKREADGRLFLQRVGPFVPPISFPRQIREFCQVPVVSVDFRDRLASRYEHLEFRPVGLSHVVRLDGWQDWPRNAKLPRVMPREGEPENYIMGRPHDAACAASMPALWEIAGPAYKGRLRWVQDPRGRYLDRLTGALPSVEHPVLLYDDRLLVTDDANDWFIDEVGAWIKSCPVDEAA